MMSGAHMMAGMGWPSMLLMLLLWGGAIALTLWGLSGLFPVRDAHVEDEALVILRQRYARGEISHEEFLQASETLRQSEPKQLAHAHQHPRSHGQ